MKHCLMLGMMFVLLAIALTACASADESAVRQVVTDAENALEAALNREASAAVFEQYFATPQEGANAAGLVETRDRWRKLLRDHVSGVSLVQISNFRITNIQIHESGGLARVTYEMDLRIVHGTQQGNATLTQNLALLKTATRGWRISGGDAPQFSNVVGTLPQ